MRSLDRRLKGVETAMGKGGGIESLSPDDQAMVRLHDAYWWNVRGEYVQELEAALDAASRYPHNRALIDLAAIIRNRRGWGGWTLPEHVKAAMRNSGRILEHEAALEALGLLQRD